MKLSRQKGFTLLELLIAITIFAVGLLTVAGMQMSAMRANVVADSTVVATAVAQGVLEELLSRPPGDGVFNNNNVQTYPLGQMIGEQVPGGSRYAATFQVFPDNPGPGMVRIRVEVVGGSTMTGGSREVVLNGFKRL
ncbi:type IV pilus modification PilV family protein [Geoalkalibacter halelectricus]|uniref:type IV pilus modification PilV family protein n=1 Tax=Geoalkalibacter halelectricus TaxID=2847045 RepID=UPI003D20D46C